MGKVSVLTIIKILTKHGVISRNRLATVNEHPSLTFSVDSYGSFDCMKVTKSMLLITYYRSNIILHVHTYEEKAVKCKVEGCGRIMKR